MSPQDIHPFGLHRRSYFSELRDLQPSRLRTVLAGSGTSSAATNYARSSSTKQALPPLHKLALVAPTNTVASPKGQIDSDCREIEMLRQPLLGLPSTIHGASVIRAHSRARSQSQLAAGEK